MIGCNVSSCCLKKNNMGTGNFIKDCNTTDGIALPAAFDWTRKQENILAVLPYLTGIFF